MKRFLALFVACICLMCGTAQAAADYTVATKLFKQLAAGSGFSGTLTLEADTESFSTQKPVVINVDYIFVRPQTLSLGEHRADFTLMDGETALTSAHVQLLEGKAALQADVIGPEWLRLGAEGDNSEPAAPASILLSALSALPFTQGIDASADAALESALDAFTTRIDIWIEGYRQNAILGKLADGTSTVEVNYTVAPAAVKSQVKQMVFDLLSDEATLQALRQALGADAAAYLDPRYQQWYFESIDALPMEGDLTISRTVALTGETLALELVLPLYTAQLGQCTLRYARTRGDGDLPDDHVISLVSESLTADVKYQEYSSMTGVNVIQGMLSVEPASGFSVSEEAMEPVAVSFTLKLEENAAKDEFDRDVYVYNAALTLAPADGQAFSETEMVFSSRFVSEERKSAATEMSATLTLSSADEAIEWTFNGKSRKKWDPTPLPAAPAEGADWDALLPAAGLKTLAVLSEFIKLPSAE